MTISLKVEIFRQQTKNWLNCFLLCFLAQQAVEKIDRTRGHAAQLFAKLLTSPLDIPHIPRKSEVLLCFPEQLRQPGSKFDEFGWSVESETFPIYAKLLNLPEYCEKVLLGLVISVGGVTERLVRQSSLYMFKELENMNSGQLTDFGQMLIKIFTVSIKGVSFYALRCFW